MFVQSLHIYPVKSAQGVTLSTANVHDRGLEYDRRFMLVSADGMFVTQRNFPKLAQLKTHVGGDGLRLSWPDSREYRVGFPQSGPRLDVTIWRDNVSAAIAEKNINKALSTWLGTAVTLVFMDGGANRTASEKWAQPASPVSFADGYPVLIVTQGSLDALNVYMDSHGEAALPMDRFRPNIVVGGASAWAEKSWKTISIGDVVIDLVKPCARCVMTSIDQASGSKGKKTALAALSKINPSNDPENPGVIFGMNAVLRKTGTISQGMRVAIGA